MDPTDRTRPRAALRALSCLAVATLATLACKHEQASDTGASSAGHAIPAARSDAASAGDAVSDAPPAVTDAALAAARDAGPPITPATQVVAVGTWVPIRRDPRRDAPLLGYMRAGAVAALEGAPVGRETCPVRREHPEGGWYRLAGGGYICVGSSLAVPWPSRHVARPVQPALDAGMPYQYAVNYGRTVMYRSLPTRDELRLYEPWRFRSETADAGAEGAEGAGEDPRASAGASGTGGAAEGNGASASAQGTASNSGSGHGASRHGREPAAATQASADPATPGAETTPDGEPRLRDLRGDRNTPVIRRLLRGMYVALDRQMRDRDTGERYWRTQSGGFVREGPLSILDHVPTFTGVELDGTHTLPFAFMVSANQGWVYRLTANGRGASYERRAPRLTAIQLSADPPVHIGSNVYHRTADGMAVNERNVRIAQLRPVPEGVGPNEKWIDIDLAQQVLVLYEGARPVFTTLVSTGRRSESDPERNYETPAGRFHVRGKHITTTMDGDTAADGPYSIEDVPWAMYFEGSYALHGAFWHGNYGWRMSHGCVNLSPPDARRVFFWVEPQLPDGWHGVFASEAHPGTLVWLHYGDEEAPRVPQYHHRDRAERH